MVREFWGFDGIDRRIAFLFPSVRLPHPLTRYTLLPQSIQHLHFGDMGAKCQQFTTIFRYTNSRVADDALRYVEWNQNLISIGMSGSRVAGYILRGAIQSKNLKHLNLGGNFINWREIGTLEKLIDGCDNLETIDLSDNRISMYSLYRIACKLCLNKSVKSINLAYNEFGGDGALTLIDMLLTNDTLRYIDLSDNGRKTRANLSDFLGSPHRKILVHSNRKATLRKGCARNGRY